MLLKPASICSVIYVHRVLCITGTHCDHVKYYIYSLLYCALMQNTYITRLWWRICVPLITNKTDIIKQ